MNKYFEEHLIDQKSIYKVTIDFDYNDGDCIDHNFTYLEKEFEEDELFQLVLCYLNSSKCDDKGQWVNQCFGDFFDRDKYFSWLDTYLYDIKGLYSYFEDLAPHSVYNVKITHYDVEGKCYSLKLKDIKDIFKSSKEMSEYINNLYKKEYDV